MARKRSAKPKIANPPTAEKSVYSDGADSMLRCYNSTEWRLEDWFSRDDAPHAPHTPVKPPRRK